MSGFVYFLTCHGRLKVGFARDVRKRIVSLQNSAPFQLQLIGFIRGTKKTERAIHDRLASHWSHGEWFEYSFGAKATVSEFLAGAYVALPAKKPRKARERHQTECVPPPWAEAIRKVNLLLERHEELIAAAPSDQRRALFNLFTTAAAEIDSILKADQLDESAAPAWLAQFNTKLEQMREFGALDRSGNKRGG